MAARRYRGAYSPGEGTASKEAEATANRFRNRPARRVHGGARLLYVAALPMLVAGVMEIFAGDAFGMAVELGSFVLLLGAAILINEGLRAEEAFNSRTVANPPAIPRKLIGAVAAGLGVGLGAAFGWGLGIISGAAFGVAATGAALLGFGLDPMRGKGTEGVYDMDGRRVAAAVDRAEALLAEMLEAARGFGDRALEERVERFGVAAREMFRQVEADPRDLNRARKFLGVYLTGARDATVKFADLYRRSRDAQARTDYEALLDDLEESFTAHRALLMQDDRSELDVEIEVLRKRLKQEGIA
ncbi:MAG: hypothetical protein D6754_05975 [Alphaproteobacteria bacterium]|nr:MAG: hypothetical protein D6754_05975 [Alphaproteobacteria bacterium]